MTLWKWSRTAASNGTADATCPFPEGMAASALNDGVRGAMAAVAKWRDDIAGAIVTAGTSSTYTVSSYQGFGSLTDLHQRQIAFSPHATNVDTVTLSVDGLTAKPLRSAPGVELLAGTLVQGSPYIAVYDNTSGAFYLKGYYSSPYNVPFLGGLDYWDTISPGSAFVFPGGQAVSRTVYSRAFARWGTTYGAGDGSTTFNIPDKTGRVSAMKEGVATRLTTGAGGVDGATMGSAAGGQTQTLLLGQLPGGITSANAAQAISVQSSRFLFGSATASGMLDFNPAGASGFRTAKNDMSQLLETSSGSNAIAVTSSNTGAAGNGAGAASPHPIVQPTIVCNYIIRIF